MHFSRKNAQAAMWKKSAYFFYHQYVSERKAIKGNRAQANNISFYGRHYRFHALAIFYIERGIKKRVGENRNCQRSKYIKRSFFTKWIDFLTASL